MQPVAQWQDARGYLWYLMAIPEGPENNSEFCIFRDTVAHEPSSQARAVRYLSVWDEAVEYWALLLRGVIEATPEAVVAWPYDKNFEVKDVLLRRQKPARRRRAAWQKR